MAKKQVKETIHAKGLEISIYTNNFRDDYISLTDIAKYKNSEEPRQVITNWLSSYSTADFLATWEELNNPNFNRMEFHTVRNERGRFFMTPKQWIEKMNGIGLKSSAGRYGGTYAQTDIALEFASWLSPEFKLYIIKDYQRLKNDESSRLSLNWNLNRELSKLNYRIHTDAIKEHIIPQVLSLAQIGITYANEADVLNVALFGKTAREWRDENPNSKGNMRDDATLNQLLVLANMESYNAILIEQGISQSERLQLINSLAIKQLETIESIGTEAVKRLGDKK